MPTYQAHPDCGGPILPGSSKLLADDDAVQELQALVAELPFHPQAQWCAVGDGRSAPFMP